MLRRLLEQQAYSTRPRYACMLLNIVAQAAREVEEEVRLRVRDPQGAPTGHFPHAARCNCRRVPERKGKAYRSRWHEQVADRRA
jgi:hypothetical protein